MLRLLTCFFAIYLYIPAVLAVQPSQINLKDRYDDNRRLDISHKVLDRGDSLDIWMEINLLRQGESLDMYTVILEKLPDYTTTMTFEDTLAITENLVHSTGSTQVYRWQMSKSSAPNLLFFVFDHKSLETNHYYDILLDQKYVAISPYAISGQENIPLFKSWKQAGDPFRVIGGYTGELQAVRYDYDFPPADPPMKTEQETVNAIMQIDTSYTLSMNDITAPASEGLYYFRSPDDKEGGASLLLTNQYFPRSRTYEDVIGPLIYISTSMERTALLESLDKKQAIDNFLVDVTRSAERGKWLIKYYFRQVAMANSLFTTYKEGWKSDQGMVFILYGLPDAVYRTAKGEEWVYDKTEEMSKIRFTFARIKNPYTDRHFVLMRSKSYERPWFTNVDLWRKARKDL